MLTFFHILEKKAGHLLINEAFFKSFLLKIARFGHISYSSQSMLFYFKKSLFSFSFLEKPLNYALMFFGLSFQKSIQYSLYSCLPPHYKINTLGNIGGLQCQVVPFKSKYSGDFVRFYSLFLVLKLSRTCFFISTSSNSDVEVSLFYRTRPVLFRIQNVEIKKNYNELDGVVFKIMMLGRLLGYTNWSSKGLNFFFGLLGVRNFVEHNYITSLSRSVYRTLSNFFNNKRLDAFW